MCASAFISLGPGHYDELYQLLTDHEPWSVLPFDALLRYGFDHPYHRWFAEVDRGRLIGIIYAYHQLLFVLYPALPAHTQLDWFLSRFFPQFTLCGSRQQLNWAKRHLYSFRSTPLDQSRFVVQSDQTIKLLQTPPPQLKGVTIRPAVKDDFHALLDLYRGTEVEHEVDQYLIWDLLRFNQVIIAEREKPIGSAMLLKESPRYCLLGGLFVDPRYRKRGIASALGFTLLKRVLNKGKQACFYYRDPAMAPFYQRGGFRAIGNWHTYAFTSK